MDIPAWLRELGLEAYEPAFRDNEVEAEVLPELTEADLVTLGLPLGARRKLLEAVAALRGDALSEPVAERPAATPVPLAEVQRRQLTVMFCDLVGSTGLSARLDPEDLRAVIGACHRCVAAVIEGAGGFVAKYTSDRVVSYFGYPRADEHDTERAVRAGLALVETFRPEFTAPWVGRPHVTALTLNRLVPRQRAEMIAASAAARRCHAKSSTRSPTARTGCRSLSRN
jgi:class 3 adenylate cyclase